MDVKFIRTNHKSRKHVKGFIFEVRRHIPILILFLFLFAGLLSGNYIISTSENAYNAAKELFGTYISALNSQNFLKNFLDNTVINMAFVVINFIFGLCAIGFPVSLVSVFTKGLSIGVLSAYMYAEFALKGFTYCLLMVYPLQIIASLTLLKAGQESFSMSLKLLRTLTERQQSSSYSNDVHSYLIRFILIIIINLILSAISALMNIYITKFFGF